MKVVWLYLSAFVIAIILTITVSVGAQIPATATGKIDDPNAKTNIDSLEKLVSQLADPKPDVRLSAAASLGKSHDPRAVSPLLSALKSPDPALRAEAALALGVFGDAKNSDVL